MYCQLVTAFRFSLSFAPSLPIGMLLYHDTSLNIAVWSTERHYVTVAKKLSCDMRRSWFKTISLMNSLVGASGKPLSWSCRPHLNLKTITLYCYTCKELRTCWSAGREMWNIIRAEWTVMLGKHMSSNIVQCKKNKKKTQGIISSRGKRRFDLYCGWAPRKLIKTDRIELCFIL